MWIDFYYKKAVLNILEKTFYVDANLAVNEILRNIVAGSKNLCT